MINVSNSGFILGTSLAAISEIYDKALLSITCQLTSPERKQNLQLILHKKLSDCMILKNSSIYVKSQNIYGTYLLKYNSTGWRRTPLLTELGEMKHLRNAVSASTAADHMLQNEKE